MSWADRRLRTAVALLLILLQCLFPVAHGLVHAHGHTHGHVHGATAAAHAHCAHSCDGEGEPQEQPAATADEDCAVCALLRLQPDPAPAPATVARRVVAARPAILPYAHGPGSREFLDTHRARGPPTAS
jgi:hypothetical protein